MYSIFWYVHYRKTHRYSLFYKINVLLKVVFKQNFNKSYQAFGSFAT